MGIPQSLKNATLAQCEEDELLSYLTHFATCSDPVSTFTTYHTVNHPRYFISHLLSTHCFVACYKQIFPIHLFFSPARLVSRISWSLLGLVLLIIFVLFSHFSLFFSFDIELASVGFAMHVKSSDFFLSFFLYTRVSCCIAACRFMCPWHSVQFVSVV